MNISDSSSQWQTGEIIDAKGLDGCSYLIKVGSGTKLQPINLDAKFQKHGLKVRFKANLARGMMSICMAGPIVKLEKIEVLDEN